MNLLPLLLAAAVSLLAACGDGDHSTAAAPTEQEKVLNVYNWADNIGKSTIADFEAKTGIKVSYG
jgi:spermidine/putrescine-binding protein